MITEYRSYRVSAGRKVGSYITTVILAACIGILFLWVNQESRRLATPLFLWIAIGFPVVTCLCSIAWCVANQTVTILDEEGIQQRGPFGTKRILWHSVRDYSAFWSTLSGITLYGEGGEHMRIDVSAIENSEGFRKELFARLPMLQPKLPIVAKSTSRTLSNWTAVAFVGLAIPVIWYAPSTALLLLPLMIVEVALALKTYTYQVRIDESGLVRSTLFGSKRIALDPGVQVVESIGSDKESITVTDSMGASISLFSRLDHYGSIKAHLLSLSER